jgi:F-type H+-transporting ATPase subunit b
MDDRDDQIKTDMENAKSNTSDVDSMLEEANKIISDAKKEANSIREKARLEATEVAEAKLAQVKATMDQKYNSFLQSLEEEKVTLKSSLVANMPLYKEGLKAKISSI